MKKLIPFAVVAILVAGCAKEEKQEDCIIGTWRKSASACADVWQYVFNSDGSGSISANACGTCPNGADWVDQSRFTWEITSSGLVLTETESYQCDDFQGSLSGVSTKTFNCDDDVLVVNGYTYEKQ